MIKPRNKYPLRKVMSAVPGRLGFVELECGHITTESKDGFGYPTCAAKQRCVQCGPKDHPFQFNDPVIWHSGFGYEVGYFLGEGNQHNTWLIDVRTGIIHEPTCYPKSEIYKYSDELIDTLSKRYGYKKQLSDIF